MHRILATSPQDLTSCICHLRAVPPVSFDALRHHNSSLELVPLGAVGERVPFSRLAPQAEVVPEASAHSWPTSELLSTKLLSFLVEI